MSIFYCIIRVCSSIPLKSKYTSQTICFVSIYGMLQTQKYNHNLESKATILLTTAVAIPAPFGADAEPRAGYLFQNVAAAVGKQPSNVSHHSLCQKLICSGFYYVTQQQNLVCTDNTTNLHRGLWAKVLEGSHILQLTSRSN